MKVKFRRSKIYFSFSRIQFNCDCSLIHLSHLTTTISFIKRSIRVIWWGNFLFRLIMVLRINHMHSQSIQWDMFRTSYSQTNKIVLGLCLHFLENLLLFSQFYVIFMIKMITYVSIIISCSDCEVDNFFRLIH